MKRVALLVVATVIAGTPLAFAGANADTRVTLDHIQVTPGGTIYTGDIFSPDRDCKNKRRVLVYRVLDGPDEKHGSTLSYKGSDQPGYYWVLEVEGSAATGDYYSKVRPTDGCKGDRSPLYPY